MKKQQKLFIVIMALFTVTFFTNCEKEILPSHTIEKQSTKKRTKASRINYRLDNVPLMSLKQDINFLLSNPKNEDDEKINRFLYELSLSIRDLIKEPRFNQVVINLAKQSETETANLLELKNVAPKYYEIINQNLSKKGLSIEKIANNLTYKPVAPSPEHPETGEIEKYIPAIFIPNLKKINPTLQPIISPNIEVDCRNNETIEDNIVCWYYTEEGLLKEIILSEETSLKTSNPLFLLDNSVTTLETKQIKSPLMFKYPIPLSETKKKNLNKGINGKKRVYSSCELGIKSSNYEYESWWGGKSEFAVNAYRIDPNGTVHWIYDSDGTKVIRKIKSSEVGYVLYKWSRHAEDWQPYSNPWTISATQYGVNMVYWNTFERDWNRSPKPLGTCTANGTTIHLSGKRKYTSEWYTWIPETTHIHYTRFQWLNAEWAHWNNSWKAYFRLWKVYI